MLKLRKKQLSPSDFLYSSTRLSATQRNSSMSTFIQEIKIATSTSLDVIMKSGRAYRYYGIDPEWLAELMSDYTTIVVEGGSVGHFYHEYIKGVFESKQLQTTTKENTPDLKELFENLQEGRAILVGNKQELDELLKIIAEHYHVQINYQGLLKDYQNITDEGCIAIREGELVLIPVTQVGYENIVAYSSITRISSRVIIADDLSSDDAFLYDVSLTRKEETEWSEGDAESHIKSSKDDNKVDEGKGLDDKTMALQALNLLEKVIGEKGYSDTDILIKTIRDYIEK